MAISHDFYNTDNDTVEEHFLTVSIADFEAANPHLKWKPMIRIGDSIRMGTYTNKLPSQFVEGILGKAKKAHPLGTIQT